MQQVRQRDLCAPVARPRVLPHDPARMRQQCPAENVKACPQIRRVQQDPQMRAAARSRVLPELPVEPGRGRTSDRRASFVPPRASRRARSSLRSRSRHVASLGHGASRQIRAATAPLGARPSSWQCPSSAVPFGLGTSIFRSGPVEPPPSNFNRGRDVASPRSSSSRREHLLAFRRPSGVSTRHTSEPKTSS